MEYDAMTLKFFFFCPLAQAPASWKQQQPSPPPLEKGLENKKKKWPLSVVPSPLLMAAAATVFSCSPLWEFPSSAAWSAPSERGTGVALAHLRSEAPASPPQQHGEFVL